MSRPIPQYLPGKPLRFIDELQGDPIGMFMNMLEAHGDLCEVKVGHLQGLFVFEASAVERVLVGNYKNYKTKESRSYGPLQKFLGEGLVTSEGELHLSQRRMLQPAFHRDRIAGFFDTMLQHANQLVAQWRPASVSGDFVDVSERICEMTLAIIGETMFDADLRPDAARIASAVRAVASRFHWTSTTLLPLAELWPTEKNLEARRAKAFLDEQVDALIERRRQRPPGDDLLGLLLDANQAQQTSTSVMRDEVLSMVVAGHETTAVELGWILWLLSTHPEVLEQVEAELDAVLGDAPITLEKTRELPVLTRTLQEVLRLYPAVWALAREAEAADELCGFPIAAGSRVFFSPFAVHRNPKYWDNPEGFDPDRFLPERSVGRPKFAYFPFSGGQRKCIGDQFTMLELTTVLATVLRAYRFELKEGTEPVPSPNVTLPMRDPLPMRLIPR
ncbi:MAG: cytochrome P450 [Archangiaceae bacterium]|nr:cytochrome P450 [Archangiaceae bacterium]